MMRVGRSMTAVCSPTTPFAFPFGFPLGFTRIFFLPFPSPFLSFAVLSFFLLSLFLTFLFSFCSSFLLPFQFIRSLILLPPKIFSMLCILFRLYSICLLSTLNLCLLFLILLFCSVIGSVRRRLGRHHLLGQKGHDRLQDLCTDHHRREGHAVLSNNQFLLLLPRKFKPHTRSLDQFLFHRVHIHLIPQSPSSTASPRRPPPGVTRRPHYP